MFTVGDFAKLYTDDMETVTVVAENSKMEFTVEVCCLVKLLYGVVGISTAEGAKITLKEDDFAAVKSYLYLD